VASRKVSISVPFGNHVCVPLHGPPQRRPKHGVAWLTLFADFSATTGWYVVGKLRVGHLNGWKPRQ